VSEIHGNGIPIPLVNYVELIRNRKSPYYDIVQFLLKEMEMHHSRMGQSSEVVYTINPRVLQEEIEKVVKDEKLTTVNVCRTILALLYGSKLSEQNDFYVTTTSGGRRNYHVKINNHTLSSMSRFL
jgi:regulator of PEP synthase PpsR (kinase-PPPase family)